MKQEKKKKKPERQPLAQPVIAEKPITASCFFSKEVSTFVTDVAEQRSVFHTPYYTKLYINPEK